MTGMGAKTNVRCCALQRYGVTKWGRKRLVRFGELPREKRTASYRPVSALPGNHEASRKQTWPDGAQMPVLGRQEPFARVDRLSTL